MLHVRFTPPSEKLHKKLFCKDKDEDPVPYSVADPVQFLPDPDPRTWFENSDPDPDST